MPQPFTQNITIPEETLSQEVNGETVILDLKSESYYGLDEVGTRIWQLLQEHGDLQLTFDIMLDEFDVDSDHLETDIDNFIVELVNSGLVFIENPKAR